MADFVALVRSEVELGSFVGVHCSFDYALRLHLHRKRQRIGKIFAEKQGKRPDIRSADARIGCVFVRRRLVDNQRDILVCETTMAAHEKHCSVN